MKCTIKFSVLKSIAPIIAVVLATLSCFLHTLVSNWTETFLLLFSNSTKKIYILKDCMFQTDIFGSNNNLGEELEKLIFQLLFFSHSRTLPDYK